jgi:hypothetical protein
MPSPVGSNVVSTSAQQSPASEPFETMRPVDFVSLSGDEIERLIGLCEAPALLWCRDSAPTREPEPFGMIA